MAISLYEITVAAFIEKLKILKSLLEKGQAYQDKDDSTLLSSRLVADMADLPYQIQRISDTAKGLAVRVGRIENETFEDNEKTFDELYARIDKTIKFLEKVDEKSFNEYEDKELIMKGRNGDRVFPSGKNYALKFAIPNFYFHLCMTYAILRKEGVPIGKMDYLGA
ncbi:hypothetical protein F5884DRAFT_180199 [Xylogone sp. PMI_703]|nr:hypothetical protein F5884DRAFT_180199 [Xylogone sp. PMI_703]